MPASLRSQVSVPLRRGAALLALVSAAVGAGCDVGLQPSFRLASEVDAGVAGDGGPGAGGLPCDVAALFQARCATCHGSPLAGGATVQLLSLTDLKKTSYADPAKDLAQRSLARVQAGTMPPGGGMSAGEIQTLSAWINAGEQAGSCQPPDMAGAAPSDMTVPPVGATGLPCDVAQVLQARCDSCHGRPLAGGATVALVTRSELLAASYTDPRATFAQRALLRMQQNTMPPGGGASASDISVFQSWVNAGAPAGSCAPPDMAGTTPPDMTFKPNDGGPPGSGLPCDVAQLFQTCASCHGNPPSGGAPMSLLTYADLVAPSINDPKTDFANRSLLRMQQNTMPPGGGAAQADITTLSNWINGGELQGSCGDGGIVVDPLTEHVACTSGTSWSRGSNSSMRPGEACINCHAGNDGPDFTLAGTLYPTGHEKDDCNAAATSIAGAKIVITDANGAVITLTPNSVGNFDYTGGGRSGNPAVAMPYTAKVVQNGKTRGMGAAQTSGDCNACHTPTGANGAPGRVTIPIP